MVLYKKTVKAQIIEAFIGKRLKKQFN